MAVVQKDCSASNTWIVSMMFTRKCSSLNLDTCWSTLLEVDLLMWLLIFFMVQIFKIIHPLTDTVYKDKRNVQKAKAFWGIRWGFWKSHRNCSAKYVSNSDLKILSPLCEHWIMLWVLSSKTVTSQLPQTRMLVWFTTFIPIVTGPVMVVMSYIVLSHSPDREFCLHF